MSKLTIGSLSVDISKYILPRSLLILASAPIFSPTSSAAVCSKPVGTVAPMVTVKTDSLSLSFARVFASVLRFPSQDSFGVDMVLYTEKRQRQIHYSHCWPILEELRVAR